MEEEFPIFVGANENKNGTLFTVYIDDKARNKHEHFIQTELTLSLAEFHYICDTIGTEYLAEGCGYYREIIDNIEIDLDDMRNAYRVIQLWQSNKKK